MTDLEKRYQAHQIAFDKMVAGERVTQVTVDGETVRFADVTLKEMSEALKLSKQAVIQAQKVKKSKIQYLGYGGRE